MVRDCLLSLVALHWFSLRATEVEIQRKSKQLREKKCRYQLCGDLPGIEKLS